jgi:hypothetical protein
MDDKLKGKLAATKERIKQLSANGLPVKKAEETELLFLRMSLSPDELAQVEERLRELVPDPPIDLSKYTDEQIYNRSDFPYYEFYLLSTLLKS